MKRAACRSRIVRQAGAALATLFLLVSACACGPAVSTPEPTVSPTPIVPSLPPQAAGRTYHISSSGGDDTADGRTPETALQSFKPLPRRFEPGDRILLKTGDVFRDSLLVAGNGTEEAPILLGAYGDGPRPRLEAGSRRQVLVTLTNGSHWRIQDLSMAGGKVGLFLQVVSAGNRDIQVRRCDFENFYDPSYTFATTDTVMQSFQYRIYFSAGIWVGGNLLSEVQAATLLDGYTVEDCTFTHCAVGLGMNWYYPPFHAERIRNVTFANLRFRDLLMNGIELRQTIGAVVRDVVIENSALAPADDPLPLHADFGVAGLFFHGVQDLELTGIDIREVHRGDSPDGCGIDFEYCRRVTLRDSQVRNCDVSAILFLDTPPGMPLTPGFSREIRIENCLFERNRVRVYTIPNVDIDFDFYSRNPRNEVAFVGCTIRALDPDRVLNVTNPSFITFTDCTIEALPEGESQGEPSP